ncbi:cell cycle checkpoint protein RAD17 isoform X3 [Iris pallida]|uniref:Cell cycle checkpoint protein RAD17 isoform X3 n=1 Tax=Iris pallida TaxID=29817 RepID=A0AAX6ECX3_IRIPA|nr:cell cycle checkpoint protein RAD17 isoform X3 [Iris pallida]
MGKRKPLVAVEEKEESERSRRATSRSRPRRPSPPSASFSAARKRSRGGSRSRPRPFPQPRQQGDEDGEVNLDMLSEDFYERRRDCRPGLLYKGMQEMWIDKHKPHSVTELAVHKKKVEEVKNWLEERVITSEKGVGSNALLITGQAGVGKSAAIHLIAEQLGADIYEWTTPIPTLWQEHVHNTNSGLCYMSKLDEFEAFTEKIRKYTLLHLSYVGGSRKPVIVLIDDLPMTNGKAAFVRLCKCLTTLARSTQVPTVILITEHQLTESVNSSMHYWEELVSSLEKVGAHKVSFNPPTVSLIKKTLSRICQEESCAVNIECLDQVARASGGDIRNAITSLQYLSLTMKHNFPLPASPPTSIHFEEHLDKPRLLSSPSLTRDEDQHIGTSLPYGRDETLSLFHALGKFLHNKRWTIDGFAPRHDSLVLQEKFRRNPLKMDSPEKILFQAHGQARRITDFLHENVLDFISDGAIDDVSLVTSYLCDADFLLASSTSPAWSCLTPEMFGFQSMVQSIAASVAARGVLFGNSHPSPSRWHTIRSPRLWQVEKSLMHNKKNITVERHEGAACNGYNFCDTSQTVYEYGARIQCLRSQTPTSSVTS